MNKDWDAIIVKQMLMFSILLQLRIRTQKNYNTIYIRGKFSTQITYKFRSLTFTSLESWYFPKEQEKGSWKIQENTGIQLETESRKGKKSGKRNEIRKSIYK